MSSICNSGPATAAAPIPLAVPHLAGRELEYLRRCVEGNWVSYAGAFVSELEEMMAAYVGAATGVACTSGTAALHVALLVAGVEPGEEVIVSDLTFIAPVNAIRYCNAYPVFMDADPVYGQMDVEKLSEFLSTQCRATAGGLVNRSSGRRVRAILPVHVLGHPVDLDPVLELARRLELVVVEDATEALGSRYRGARVGSLGDIGCFSFNGNKIITSGGGGMIVTKRADWGRRARHITTQAKVSQEEYEHDEVGYNYRLTNLQAAVGVAQMEQLEGFIARKREISARYNAAFADVAGLQCPREAPWAWSNSWLYTVRVDAERFGMPARALQRWLARNEIQSRPLWGPMHCQVPYQPCQAYRVEVSDRLYQTSLSLPCSSGLSAVDQGRVIDAVKIASRAGGAV